MPEDVLPPPVAIGASQELLDLIPRIPLLPGESSIEFEDLRHAFLFELAPSNAYQAALAENLTALEWEIHRHRKLRDGLLRSSYRAAAQEFWTKEKFGGLSGGIKNSEKAVSFAEGLLNPASAQAASSLAWLAEHHIDPSEIAAKAYRNVQDALEPHERKLADLEIRRRRLRDDYDRLKATRTRPIEEAHFVRQHGD
tara:strand:- start:4914 stop:5504 length:591 start_codon:yes stop_codon:yes gene_type:complete